MLKLVFSCFYADDGRIAGLTQATVQRGLDILLDLFARFGLFPNVNKTKAMVSLGHRFPDTLSPIAFKRRYDDRVPTYYDRKRAKVQCPHCSLSMSNQHLPTHIRHVHHMLPPNVSSDFDTDTFAPSCKRPRLSPPSVSLASNHYAISLDADVLVCPIPNCPAWTLDPRVLRTHLCIRHPLHHFTFAERQDLTQCPRCGLFLTRVTPAHFQSKFCIRQSARRDQAIMQSQLATAVSSTPFYIGGKPLEFVPHFRYLGRILSQDDSDDMAAYLRLEETKKVWARFSHLLRANGASVKTMGRFYRTILQQKLLFGSATWVLSLVALNRLERFHARCARGIAHRPIRRRPNGTWICPPTTEVLEACGLQPLSVYIQHRRDTLLKHYAQKSSQMYPKCLSLSKSSRFGVWWNLAS
jgi:hypothetical protein